MSEDEIRAFNVLLEDIRDRVKFIAEGHSLLADKVDGIAEDVGTLKTDVRLIKDNLGLNGAPKPSRPAKKKRSRKR